MDSFIQHFAMLPQEEQDAYMNELTAITSLHKGNRKGKKNSNRRKGMSLSYNESIMLTNYLGEPDY